MNLNFLNNKNFYLFSPMLNNHNFLKLIKNQNKNQNSNKNKYIAEILLFQELIKSFILFIIDSLKKMIGYDFMFKIKTLLFLIFKMKYCRLNKLFKMIILNYQNFNANSKI